MTRTYVATDSSGHKSGGYCSGGICIARSGSDGATTTQLLLHIPQAVDPEFVTVAYLVQGMKRGDGYANFGTSGSYLGMTATQDIPISLRLPRNKVRATSFRAILVCRGYGLALVTFRHVASEFRGLSAEDTTRPPESRHRGRNGDDLRFVHEWKGRSDSRYEYRPVFCKSRLC